MFLFALLEIIQKAHAIQRYISWYYQPAVPCFMHEEEAGKLQVVFSPQEDLKSKFINVGNVIDPTRSPDNLSQILYFSISDNLNLFH